MCAIKAKRSTCNQPQVSCNRVQTIAALTYWQADALDGRRNDEVARQVWQCYELRVICYIMAYQLANKRQKPMHTNSQLCICCCTITYIYRYAYPCNCVALQIALQCGKWHVLEALMYNHHPSAFSVQFNSVVFHSLLYLIIVFTQLRGWFVESVYTNSATAKAVLLLLH